MNSTIKNIEIIEMGEKSRETSSPWSSTILLVKLTSADGLVGYGEAPTTLMTLPVLESMKEVARVFNGKDFFNVEQNVFDFYRNSFYLPVSMEATSALSAFEIASWDLIGKQLGAPVYKLMGGEVNKKMRAYANGWYNDCVSPEDFLKKAKEVVKMGFTAMKFDPFGDNYDSISNDGLENAKNIVGTLRSELGDKIDLLIEYHGRFSKIAAIKAGMALEEYHPFFYEEPLHPDLDHDLLDLKSYYRVPIALGERVLNKKIFARFISQKLVDIIQPDLTNSGGILEGKKIAAIADGFGIPVAPHNAFGPIQTAATLNLDTTITNFIIQESFEMFWPDWKKKLVSGGYKLENGYFSLTGEPGVARVNEDIVEKYQVSGMEPFDDKEPPWVVSGTFKPYQQK
ncbi:mandelate racemase/muconate lactonizing enzyme family protein [Thermoplasma sp.]|uniref:mandelate racemase/muconate lactonizing enzyme family protein n=1 Tax=Thermoplasma sp. TaxID=1973142 RepID=UPI00261347CA|nr:mandelate racemase/muconate lactonizing enzyme family protein [Thermoplasma sp.]